MTEKMDGKSVAALRGRALHPTCGHLAEFAVHIIPAGVPMVTGALLAAYRNLGNEIDASTERQRREEVIKHLSADDRLEYDSEIDAFWIKGTKPEKAADTIEPAPLPINETAPAEIDPPVAEAPKADDKSKGGKKV